MDFWIPCSTEEDRPYGIFRFKPKSGETMDCPMPLVHLAACRDLVFHSILCETRGRIVLTAQDGSCIEHVSLDNVHLRIPDIEDPQRTVPAARSQQLSNFNPITRAARAAIVADNVKGLHLRDVRVAWPENSGVPMHATCLRRCEDVRLESPALQPSSPDVPFALTPAE